MPTASQRLSGSQTFKLMRSASESLSGRVTIVEPAPLSLREIQGDRPFHPAMDYVLERQASARKPENLLADRAEEGEGGWQDPADWIRRSGK